MEELPQYQQLSDSDSVYDEKQSSHATELEAAASPSTNTVKLIKTSHGGISGSAIRVEGSDNLLYSFKRTSMKSFEMYRGDFSATEYASTSAKASKPANLFATINVCSIDYIHPNTEVKTKIPEGTFLYHKHWYHM